MILHTFVSQNIFKGLPAGGSFGCWLGGIISLGVAAAIHQFLLHTPTTKYRAKERRYSTTIDFLTEYL